MSNETTTPSGETPVVIADELTKVFRDFWRRPKVRAVDHLHFEIRRGEVFGLLGPNGSGKSTTIKMMLGLLHPTHGRLRIFDQSPRDVKTKARVGYLPEESYLYPYLTSEETLQFFGRLFDLSARHRRERIDQLLEMVGLQHTRHRVIGEFSKGMARRIGLAQALINDPDLIILDEPTSGLDPLGCRQVKNLIHTLARRGKTVLLSSHLLADVEDVCDRVAILYNGRIQAMGSITDLLEQKDRYRVTLPEELPPDQLYRVLAELRALLGESAVEHPRIDLEQFFLQIIEKARDDAKSGASGATPARGIADYLAKTEPSGTERLGRLAGGQASSPTALERELPAPAPASLPKEEVNMRLRHLTQAQENDTADRS